MPCLHIWSVFVVQLSRDLQLPRPPRRWLVLPLSSHSSLGVGRDSKRMEVEEEGQREEERNDAAERPSADPAAGWAPKPDPLHGNVSYRQPEAVLLFLHRLQGGQSAEVLLHIGLLHLIVRRDQDLRQQRGAALSHCQQCLLPLGAPAPP